ncbi:anaerobic ribonucleoside-triphosphate reductase activating protein [Demequina sp. NBRC 110054]|uniref:anaerobic ribonucleoside-triphosphate reductase activating protein n=1 Tax=Demequina sp. NBRC 110054 TaxID=1570343 RepID=UPI000A01321F|nr:anaerobic ribonucleoside-triphosphate reductase activating protein [Demequina sp. NBRC 110054]
MTLDATPTSSSAAPAPRPSGDAGRERPLHRPVFTSVEKAPVPTGDLTIDEVCAKAREESEPVGAGEPAPSAPEPAPASAAPAASPASATAPVPQPRAKADRLQLNSTDAAFLGIDSGFDPKYLAIAALTSPSIETWPGHLASTVLLQGCPWRCTYCFSPDLQDARAGGTLEWAAVVEELRARVGESDAVLFSGGEPTRQGALPEAMKIARSMGYKVGLQTAGGFPGRFGAALKEADWVAFDVKATPAGYEAITRTGGGGRRAYASLDMLVASGVEYEVRLTVDPVTHTRDDVLATVVEIERRTGRPPVLQQVSAEGVTPTYAEALAGRCLADVLPDDVRPDLVRH